MSRIARFLLFVVGCSPGLFSQPTRSSPTLDAALRQAGLRVVLDTSRSRTSSEIRIRWQSQAARVIQRIDRSDPPPKQRSPELSPDHLVIAFLDDAGTVRHTQVVVDPRLVRGEFPDANGNLRKTELVRDDVEMSVSAPGGLNAAEVRVFTPNWDSGELRLLPLGSVTMPGGPRQ
jgi:hypothetical protein